MRSIAVPWSRHVHAMASLAASRSEQRKVRAWKLRAVVRWVTPTIACASSQRDSVPQSRSGSARRSRLRSHGFLCSACRYVIGRSCCVAGLCSAGAAPTAPRATRTSLRAIGVARDAEGRYVDSRGRLVPLAGDIPTTPECPSAKQSIAINALAVPQILVLGAGSAALACVLRTRRRRRQ